MERDKNDPEGRAEARGEICEGGASASPFSLYLAAMRPSRYGSGWMDEVPASSAILFMLVNAAAFGLLFVPAGAPDNMALWRHGAFALAIMGGWLAINCFGAVFLQGAALFTGGLAPFRTAIKTMALASWATMAYPAVFGLCLLPGQAYTLYLGLVHLFKMPRALGAALALFWCLFQLPLIAALAAVAKLAVYG